MGLKKNFFKGLQNGLSTSPIKQENGVDLKNFQYFNPGIMKEKIKQTNDYLNSIKNAPEIDRRNQINLDYRARRLKDMKKLYPDASDEDLNAYLFSNKKGILPEDYISPAGGVMYGQNAKMLTDQNLPSDALAVNDLSINAYKIKEHEKHSINNPRDYDNDMYGLSLEEKTKLVNNKIKNLNLDPRNVEQNYQKETLENFSDWYMNPITQKRLLEQAQFSGNIRSEKYDAGLTSDTNKFFETDNDQIFAQKELNYGRTAPDRDNKLLTGASNVAGSLVGQADIDNIMTGIANKKFTFEQERDDYGNLLPNVTGSVDPAKANYNKNYPNMSTHDLVNIDPDTLGNSSQNYSVNDTNLVDVRRVKEQPNHIRAKQHTGSHELLHNTRLDKLMDPALRTTLKGNYASMLGGNDRHQYKYNTTPGELYSNFHEFRKSINMKPGEQFDEKKLNERIKETGMEDDDFKQNFTTESLIKALNTIADADKKTPGKNKFEDLKMMESLDMNTGMA